MNELMDDIGQGTMILAFGAFMILTAPVWIPAWMIGRVVRWWLGNRLLQSPASQNSMERK